MEANSYKRSIHEEFKRNEEFLNLLHNLNQEQISLQNNFKTCLDKYNNLKDEYSKLIQITDFQNQNLDHVIFVCIL